MKSQIKKDTHINLKDGDCGIIFKKKGECQIYIPNTNPDDDISEIEILVSGLGLFLRDSNFQNMIKSEFIKHVQNSLTADKIEDSTDDKV